MGTLADKVLEYLESTPSEQLRRDWDELKQWNTQGPNILDVISNYGQGTIVLQTPLLSDAEKVQEVKDDFPNSYNSSSKSLCMAA